MRPVDKSRFTTNQAEYDPYGEAKPELFLALGPYCSYCEREGFSAALDVEHIEDKDAHPDKETLWNNFLLGCKNCNSIKGTKEIDFNNIILPHLDNTFTPFEYLESGYIKIKDSITEPLKTKVNNLLSLVGLDRRPGVASYSKKDTRWQERKQVWEISKKFKQKYIEDKCDIETIVFLSQNSGFWSIWMHSFNGFPEVQRALINSHAGTRLNYFTHIPL
ncbi:TIGR02646 family protein [Flavobacterium fontis]|uniref:TIGR02646 family protein n=1 Tax=Flavobacterium fontis TaxID=1124188 RepID=A0A1M5EBR9_9FLAO|nr:HNH endonuclease [Flavobacterium fontis]SHF76610.1 TIGR02646 family protein [Flavobacterium fontis]